MRIFLIVVLGCQNRKRVDSQRNSAGEKAPEIVVFESSEGACRDGQCLFFLVDIGTIAMRRECREGAGRSEGGDWRARARELFVAGVPVCHNRGMSAGED